MTATHPSEDIRTGRNRLAATVTIGHAVKHLYNSGLRSLILPEIKLDLNLSGAQFGALATSREITAWTITMVAGYLGDRYINRSGLMVGLSIAIIGVSYWLISLPNTFWPLFAIMFFAGLGPSLYHPPAIGELSRRFPDRRGFAISLHGTGGIAGEVLGPLVVAGLLALMSWRGVLQAGLLPALAAAFTLWAVMNSLRRNDTPNVSARGYLTAFGELIQNRALVLLVSVSAIRIMGESAVANFLPVFLREDLNFSPTRVAVYLSLAQVAGLGAQPAMGYLSDRFGRKAVLLPGLTVVSLLSMALGFTGPRPASRPDRDRQRCLLLLSAPHLHRRRNRRVTRKVPVDGGGIHLRFGTDRDLLSLRGRASRRPVRHPDRLRVWGRYQPAVGRIDGVHQDA